MGVTTSKSVPKPPQRKTRDSLRKIEIDSSKERSKQTKKVQINLELQGAPEIATDITELIGNTPLISLQRVNEGVGNIVCKLESHNPAASVKDRIALSMIVEAEKRGDIQPGDTLVEPTSGNTGVAMAMVCAVKGYKFVSCMPETMSMERRVMIRAYGAELIITPASKGLGGAEAMCQKIIKERGAKMLQQFENFDNPKIHRETTGPEIWQATKGKVDYLVCGVGTGGTISGCTQFLKEKKPAFKSVAVEPAESNVLSGGTKGPHKIQGLGAGFVPKVYDPDIVDEVIPISS